MLVIRAKKIKIILFCIFIGVFTFSFQIANNKGYVNNNEKNVTETVATPVSGKRIIIDAGHGSPDEGAESSSRND